MSAATTNSGNIYSYVGGARSFVDSEGLMGRGSGARERASYPPGQGLGASVVQISTNATNDKQGWWRHQPPEKKCEYKCSAVLGVICKPAYKVSSVYGKVGAYAAARLVSNTHACGRANARSNVNSLATIFVTAHSYYLWAVNISTKVLRLRLGESATCGSL